MNFPTSSYCFLRLSFLNVKKKAKKNTTPFGIVPDVWCEIWTQFFFFPQMGYSTTPFIEKSMPSPVILLDKYLILE